MKAKILNALMVVGLISVFACDLENDRGRRRVIVFKRGSCNQTRPVDGHERRGKLYPVALMWLGHWPKLEAGNAWMCYAHASEWRNVAR